MQGYARTGVLMLAAALSVAALAGVVLTPSTATADGCCSDGIDCRWCPGGGECIYGSNPSCGSSLPDAYCRLNEVCEV